MPSHWHQCALCDGAAEYAIVGNRLLSYQDVKRLPPEPPPVVSWRCQRHWRYQMRTATGAQADPTGDLILTLVCGHEVHWVCRGQGAYTPAVIERGIAARQIRLDQRQRCYLCADREQESEAELATGQER